MTPEEKQLLLKDLSSRLTYEVKVQIIKNLHLGVFTLYPSNIDELKTGIADIKPYLRPMSSMTGEEKKELAKYFGGEIDWCNINYELCWEFPWDYLSFELEWNDIIDAIDFFNRKHFDYRGLIEKGLALEATEGMY